MTAIIVTVSGQAVILVSAVLGYLSARRKISGVDSKLSNVHALVNNQLDRQLRYNGQLAATLTENGVPVPQQEDPGPRT